ncbi:MAG TPA: tripartite tricarboxylate transporter substrate binding protein [Xanthobacteraceae bacterium]
MFGRFFAIAFFFLALGAARADDYPSRTIRIVVGPGPDIVARVFADVLSKSLGQPVVVEQRPGAGGVIAAQTVSAAPPDGYLLLQATASYTINTALQSGSLDIGRDFAPVALVSTIPFVLVVHPSVPAKTLAELIAYAKANPGKLNYASSGVGTPPHMAGELFKFRAGVDIVHVPYREANSGLAAVIGGAVQMMFSIASTAKSQIDGGTVRGIAVTSLKPSALVPDLPAVAQAGLAGFEVIGWNGFVAPKATPQPIIAKLNRAILDALATAEVREKLKSAGYEIAAANSPQQFADFIAADTAKWLDLATRLNLKAN